MNVSGNSGICGIIHSEGMGSFGNHSRFHGRQRQRDLFRVAGWFLPFLLCLLGALTVSAGPQQTPAASPDTAPAVDRAPVGLTYKYAPGERAVYQLVYESTAHADLRPLFQDNSGQAPAQSSSLVYALSADLRGQWVATILDTEAGRIRAIYELRDGDVRVTVNGQQQAAQAEGVKTCLSHGILAEMGPDGKVLAVYVDSLADKFSRDFALSLFGITEFVLPSAGETDRWQSREEDRTGVYTALYQSFSAAPAATNPRARTLIRKTKMRYSQERNESTLPGQTSAQKQVVPSGMLEARFDGQQGQLVSLAGTEVQDTIINGKPVAHSAITLQMTRVAGKELRPDDLQALRRQAKGLAASGSRLALYTKVSPQEMQSSIQRTQLGSETLASLLQQLSAVEKLQDKSDQSELYLKFKALVYLHPEACSRLGAMIAAADPQSPTFVILARALGAVGNAQAQDALAAAIKARPGDFIAVANLLPTLAEAPEPTPAAEETIRQLSSSPDASISSTATLSLGSMAHGLAKKSPARSNRIVRDLLEQAARTEQEDRLHDLIEALGNTQSATALPALAAFARNAAPRVRAAALDGLRFMPAPRADVLLLSGLGDSDGVPRLEAAYALSFRSMTPESFAAQKKALLRDDNDKVRAALLANLWKVHAKFPEVHALVENAANQDASEYVRKVAKGMLLESP